MSHIQEIRQRLTSSIYKHRFALGIVALACLCGQVVILTQQTPIGYFPDSADYLHAAANLGANIIDQYRTPGYSIFVAIGMAMTGWKGYTGILVMQVMLMIAVVFEIYLLTWRICSRQWVAGLAATLIALNPYVIDWERSILSETLSLWLLVTTFLVFERAVNSLRPYLIVLTAITSITLAFTRPIFMLVPFILLFLLAIHVIRMGIWHNLLPSLGLAVLVIFGSVGTYVVTNGIVNHYYGISYIFGVNAFAKVLHYNLEKSPAVPQYGQLQRDAITYRDHGQYEPWNFARDYGYTTDNYAAISGFTATMVLHHPLGYLHAAEIDGSKTLTAPSQFYASVDTRPWWVGILKPLGDLQSPLYFVSIIAALWAITRLWLWRAPHDPTALTLLALILASWENVFVISIDGYDEFFRVRSLGDWAVMIGSVVFIAKLGEFVAKRLQPKDPRIAQRESFFTAVPRAALMRIGARASQQLLGSLDYWTERVLSQLEAGKWLRAHDFPLSPVYSDRRGLYTAVSSKIANERVLYLEFGVFQGASMRIWSELLKNPQSSLHGFDSFEGLPEYWNALNPQGTFDVKGNIPTFDDPRVQLHRGWFDQTLPSFTLPPYDYLIIHVDVDLYSSAAFVLQTLRSYVRPGTIIIFDEFYDRKHELKAFDEFIAATNMTFRFLGSASSLSQCAFECVTATENPQGEDLSQTLPRVNTTHLQTSNSPKGDT